jgi:hypothetical protein
MDRSRMRSLSLLGLWGRRSGRLDTITGTVAIDFDERGWWGGRDQKGESAFWAGLGWEKGWATFVCSFLLLLLSDTCLLRDDVVRG